MGNTKKIKVETLIERQYKAECAFMKDYHDHDYTFENPKIIVNPYLINPCAALVMFKTNKPTAVTVCVKGKTKDADISHTYGKEVNHILPVLGLYDNYENTVEIRLYQGASRQIKIQTTGHPLSTEVISMETKPEILGDQLVVVTPVLAGVPTGVDAHGDIRWYFSENMLCAGKKLANGHFMIGTEKKLLAPYNTTGLYETDLIGKIYKEYRIPGLYHHDQIEMEDGTILALSQNITPESDSVEDVCVVLNRETGEVERTIDYKNFLPRGAAPSGCWSERDWFHNNALAYDKYSNALIISGRHMDSLVCIDYDTEKINWIIGDPENWPEDMQDLFFTPKDDPEFSWQYEQHAVLVTPDGDIMCFDNGHWRSKNKDKYLLNRDNYSRGVRFRINKKDKTIEQIWQYGKERGACFFSSYISNVEYYGEGHYLVHSGGIQQVDGTAAEDFIPPEKMKDAEVISRTVEVCGDEVVMEMVVKNNFYRGTKIDLYEEGSNLTLGKGSSLGHLYVSVVDEKQPFIPSSEDVPAEMQLHIIEDKDCFYVKGRFPDNAKAYIYLVNDEGPRALRIITTPNKFDAVSCKPYIDEDPTNKNAPYSKEDLCGTYHLYLSVEDQYYDTGVDIQG